MSNKSDRIIIKNGLIFDPLLKIKGEKKDILIEKGIIVEKFSSNNNIKEINAENKTVIPAAIDIHTHIASQQINWVRLLGKENKEFQKNWEGLTLRYIARNYISNGYTFITEANVYPSLSKQTIFNFINLPVLDKAMLLNLGNFWPLEFEFEKGKIDEISYFLSDLLSKCKGFGIKAYNPFEGEIWNLNTLRENIKEKGKLYNFTAIDVYKHLIYSIEKLDLPHSIHCHIEGYEHIEAKDNLNILLEELAKIKIDRIDSSRFKREQICHLAHANSLNMDGDNTDLIKFLNNNKNVDLDLAFIGFDEINPIITSDRRFITNYKDSSGKFNKIIINSNESEGDSYTGFRKFSKSNYNDCILWSNSIDLALNIKNKWQVQFSLNFPHYSHVNKIPKIASWLLSKEARKIFMEDMDNKYLKISSIFNNDNVLDFNDYIIITRASPAKSLGLTKYKGNLDVGTDADINILDIDITKIDSNRDFKSIEKAFENIEYVIKNGNIVKKGDKIFLGYEGKIFWAEGKIYSQEDKLRVVSKKSEFYQKYYSYFYNMLENNVNKDFLKKII
ncbi:MAG: amidohydrolase family protein [Candidatus Lokiarchaeota archaeon]|nr:amidohydrolase family protein [Candidatus Lokiarchaeota archaeon]